MSIGVGEGTGVGLGVERDDVLSDCIRIPSK